MPTVDYEELDDDHGFVDRDEILKELEHHMNEVSAANGRVIFLKGETGVGKTALAEEFMERCKEEGFEILRGRCLYYESGDPYLPFFDALDEYIGEDQEEDVNEPEDMMPGMMVGSSIDTSEEYTPMSLMGTAVQDEEEEEMSRDISLADRREMMFSKITNLVLELSKKQPILLYLDDLQWIDDSSSQLLHHLSRDITSNRVLILGSYRPEELKYGSEDLPLSSTINRMKEDNLLKIIDVPRLDHHSVSSLIKNYLQREDLPESFIWTMYRVSEGNPYYVVEILNNMVNEGIIDPYSYTWDAEEELSNIKIPSTIKDITSRKIEKLDKDEKKVLMYASLLGTEFNFEILEEVINMDVIELLDIVDSLVDQGIIQEVEGTDDEIYRFHHVQTRTTIYENMAKSRKRVLHQQIGKVMEDIFSDQLEEHYYELGEHFYEGKVYDKAYEYSNMAGHKAVRGLDLAKAVNFFDQALESLEKSRGIEDRQEKKINLYEIIGELSYEINDWDRSLDAWEKLGEIAEDKSDLELQAEVNNQIGDIHKEMDEYTEARDYFERALELSEEEEYLEGVAKAYMGLGYVSWRDGKLDKAIELFEEAIGQPLDVSKAEPILASAQVEMGKVYAHKGQPDEAIEYFKRGVDYFKQKESYSDLAMTYNDIGDQYMRKGDNEQAIEYFKKTIENGRKIGSKKWIGWGVMNLADALVRNGDLDEADKNVKKAMKIMELLRDSVGQAGVHSVKGMLEEKRSNWDEALKHFQEALKISERIDVAFQRGEYRYRLANIYKKQGKVDKAQKLWKEAKRIFEGLGSELFLEKTNKRLQELKE